MKISFRLSGIILLLAAASLLFTSYCFTKKKSILVRGTVSHIQPYCGGAAPSPEILANLKKPVPSPNFVLHFKKGSANNEKEKVITTVTTNANGYFEVLLPKGEYCIVEDYKGKPFAIPAPANYTTWDTTCLKNAYAGCDYKLNVATKTRDTIKLVYRGHCFYSPKCGRYEGPMPPSAPPRGK